MPTFKKLNDGWNAEPNSPEPQVEIIVHSVVLSFYMNALLYSDVDEGSIGQLIFSNCARYRLGPTNDEGWYRGQCRYTGHAPGWGEFYEISGDDALRDLPRDWCEVSDALKDQRHFLFYLRDETFECFAQEWCFELWPPRFKQPAASARP